MDPDKAALTLQNTREVSRGPRRKTGASEGVAGSCCLAEKWRSFRGFIYSLITVAGRDTNVGMLPVNPADLLVDVLEDC